MIVNQLKATLRAALIRHESLAPRWRPEKDDQPPAFSSHLIGIGPFSFLGSRSYASCLNFCKGIIIKHTLNASLALSDQEPQIQRMC